MGTVGRCVLACGCIAGVGVAYVWQKNQIYRLGDELKKREAAVVAAQKRAAVLAAHVAQLKSPALLEASCRQHGLGLVAPREGQIVRLPEPGQEWETRLWVPAAATAAKKPAQKAVTRR
ncbi:MAG: septum formation initiator family protein [Verrucomicrobiae bacterium]|nr:septum formation initiator family protein [Verrucomicrobiae bacterium]